MPTCIVRLSILALFGLVLTMPLHAQQPRIAFATSVTGDGDLGSWPESGSLTGADAGDAICQTLAGNAGLANPLNFVAWLSTSTDDAYCRLHGLTGTKASNCGQAMLPIDAGPWVRPDGRPFAETIDRLLAPENLVYYPPEVDELGGTITSSYPAYSMTSENGVLGLAHTTCNDWSASNSEWTQAGTPVYGSVSWTTVGSVQCGWGGRLLCLERLSGPPLNPPAETGALAFVTSVRGSGDLSSWPDAGDDTGIAAGDAICRARAAAGGLPNPTSFKAWLSDTTVDAVDRFQYQGPRVRPDGVQIATSLADLTDGRPVAPINVSELGDYVGPWDAWTATAANGRLDGDACADWISADTTDTSLYGRVSFGLGSWTQLFQGQCNRELHLYCLSDDASVLFADGFESGTTVAWSATVPATP